MSSNYIGFCLLLICIVSGQKVSKPTIPAEILNGSPETQATYIVDKLLQEIRGSLQQPRRDWAKRSLDTLETLQYLVYLLKECKDGAQKTNTAGPYVIPSSEQRPSTVKIDTTLAATTTTPATTTTTLAAMTTTPATTITAAIRPIGPCTSPCTVNLTEWWRKDAIGSNIKPVNNSYACDSPTLLNRWFRFTGAAGKQLSNSCRPDYSCGTHAGYWTDAAMPTVVGVNYTVPIYASWTGNCKWMNKIITIIRCSTQIGDYVYSYSSSNGCSFAMCGMD